MASTRIAPTGNRKRRLVVTIVGIVVVIDAATKEIAVRALAGRGVAAVLGGALHLELYRNFAGPGNILPGIRSSFPC